MALQLSFAVAPGGLIQDVGVRCGVRRRASGEVNDRVPKWVPNSAPWTAVVPDKYLDQLLPNPGTSPSPQRDSPPGILCATPNHTTTGFGTEAGLRHAN